MHVGYCEVYSYSFRLFFCDDWSRSSWKVPQEGKFQGMKVLKTFAPEERGAKVPRSECSTERKFHRSKISICGLSAPGSESAEERKVRHSLKYAIPCF